MSEALARSEAARLKAAMGRHGVRCSIELQVGRPNRTGWGDDWYSRKVALMQHHTAGATTGNTPSLSLVKRGRGTPGTDGYLPGPLANGYGGRDHVYRVLTLGLANHPGEGGPITVPRIGGGSVRIPEDSARHLTWGTEWEHDGVSPWPADMQEFMGRAGAALTEWLELPRETSMEHLTWAPHRKTDRNGYTAASGDAEIQRWRAAGVTSTQAEPTNPHQEDEDMKVIQTADGRTWITNGPFSAPIAADLVKSWCGLTGQLDAAGNPKPAQVPYGLAASTTTTATITLIQNLAAQAAANRPDIDEAALAADLAPLLGVDVDEAAVAQQIVTALPDSLAQQVLDGLAQRLAG